MPRIPGRREPITTEDVRRDLGSGEWGGGPLTREFMTAQYRAAGANGTLGELRRTAAADLEMLRKTGSAEEYWRFIEAVRDYHNGHIEAGNRAGVTPNYSYGPGYRRF